jgi:hypothetical protein
MPRARRRLAGGQLHADRPAAEVIGPKAAWAATIAVKFAGRSPTSAGDRARPSVSPAPTGGQSTTNGASWPPADEDPTPTTIRPTYNTDAKAQNRRWVPPGAAL